jgi:hypothetical protein
MLNVHDGGVSTLIALSVTCFTALGTYTVLHLALGITIYVETNY